MRPLLLDDALPVGLEAEVLARGRACSRADPSASDADLLALPVVLVTPYDLDPLPDGAAVALVRGASAAERRDAVHRHAHAMATQRPGTRRTYR